ncbi:E3 ubiquitin-protein ligase TRIM62-like [Festucalex cinctus]
MAENIEDNLRCPSCLGIFENPVMLPCSHSFCRECVRQWFEKKGDRSCPVCRTKFVSMDLPQNLALRNVCEAFSRASVESEDMCSLHYEKLKLFCSDHQKLVCHRCRNEEVHIGHEFYPLEKLVQERRLYIQEALSPLQKRVRDYKAALDSCNKQADKIKKQKEKVETKIKKDFEEFRRFLQAEEEARLAAVREEEQKKSQMIKEKIEAYDRDQAALTADIQSAEELLTCDHVFFMKTYKDVLARIKELPNSLKLPSRGGLLDEAKHVGNLKFSVWERMKETISYSPVIMDPNTADPEARLYEDLTCLSFKGRQERSTDSESGDIHGRHRYHHVNTVCVLGSALAPGSHTWDVEVEDNNDWTVGIRYRKSAVITTFSERDKFCTFPARTHRSQMKLKRVRIHVDTDKGVLSISDPLTKSELSMENCVCRLWENLDEIEPYDINSINIEPCSHDVLKDFYRFNEWRLASRLFPYFETSDIKKPLQIIPLTPRVELIPFDGKVDASKVTEKKMTQADAFWKKVFKPQKAKASQKSEKLEIWLQTQETRMSHQEKVQQAMDTRMGELAGQVQELRGRPGTPGGQGSPRRVEALAGGRRTPLHHLDRPPQPGIPTSRQKTEPTTGQVVIVFFNRFSFSLTYRPGSKNVKADALSRIHDPETTATEPEPILPRDCIVGAMSWQVEEDVKEALQDTIVPKECPPRRLYVPEGLRAQVINWAHTSRLSCHPGITPFKCVHGYDPPYFADLEEEASVPSVLAMTRRCRRICWPRDSWGHSRLRRL